MVGNIMVIKMSKITLWIIGIKLGKAQPLRELMPALMISSTSSKLEAITVHEFTI